MSLNWRTQLIGRERRGQEKLAVRLTKLEGRNLNFVAAALVAIMPKLSC